MYWWYNFGDYKYEGHFTEGLFVVGTNPGNVQDDAVVTGKAQLGDKLLTVEIGDAARMRQKMADRDLRVRIFGKDFHIRIVKAQLALSDKQHDRSCREHLGDRCHFKNAVLPHRKKILRVSEAVSAF